jgi:hypothetical protein
MYKLFNNIKNKLKVILKKKKSNSPERNYFEKIIIPALGLHQIKNVLFVGVGPYTWHYQKLFNSQGINLYTVDVREEASIWGVKGKHKCVNVLNSDFNPFPEIEFDLIILIGVIGYGINIQNDVIVAFNNFLKILINKNSKFLVACEDKFNLIPNKIINENNINLKLINSFGFNSIIEIPQNDYKFYFFKKIK